jgi:hypothetical protein
LVRFLQVNYSIVADLSRIPENRNRQPSPTVLGELRLTLLKLMQMGMLLVALLVMLLGWAHQQFVHL